MRQELIIYQPRRSGTTLSLLPVSSALFLMASSSLVAAQSCLENTAGTGVPINSQLCDLGTLQGGGISLALSVSRDGMISVGWAFDANNIRQPVYWGSDGSINVLEMSDGDNQGRALDASENGATIVGLSGTSAALWQNGVLTVLGPGRAESVNSDGTVIVGTSGTQAFRWVNGTGVGLGFAGDDTQSRALRVNADGSVVVGQSGGFSGTAFRWVDGQGMQSLGRITGGTYTLATGVSDDGNVVAGYGNNQAGDDISFRWTELDGFVDIGSLYANSPGTYAYDMNADGTVIVGESYNVDFADGRAFRWVLGEGMQSLGTLSGGTYSGAFGVSASGDTVVGWSDSLNGYRAFIWRGVIQDYTNLLASLPAIARETELALDAQQYGVTSLIGGRGFARGAGQSFFSVFGGASNTGSGDGMSGRNASLGGLSYGYGVTEQVTLGFSVTANGTDVSSNRFDLNGGFGAAVWGVYSENGSRHTGLQGNFALGYLNQDATITRGIGFDDVEAATGSSDLTTRSARLELGYGFEYSSGWILTPTVGIVHHSTTRGAYAEDSDATAFSATYDRLEISSTIGTLGITGDWQFAGDRRLSLGAGVDFDLDVDTPTLAGSSNIPGMEIFAVDGMLSRNDVRPYAVASYSMDITNAARLTASVRAGRAADGDRPEFGLGLRYAVNF